MLFRAEIVNCQSYNCQLLVSAEGLLQYQKRLLHYPGQPLLLKIYYSLFNKRLNSFQVLAPLQLQLDHVIQLIEGRYEHQGEEGGKA